MYTKKIIIKNEEHFNEVVKALKSIGHEVYCDVFFSNLEMIFDSDNKTWYRIFDSYKSDFENVPEYEIKTSYELKEVPKIKITCKNCGKTIEYKDLNDPFKEFVVFKGSIDYGDKSLSVSEYEHICKDCIKKLLND